MFDGTCVSCRSPKTLNKTRVYRCGGCGCKKALCQECGPVFIACSEECRAKWRAEAAAGVPKELLIGPSWITVKRPQGHAKFQGELFGKVAPLC